MTGGTFEMYGGSIANNTATNYGGAVYMTGGTFEMSGGSIANNTATNYGGAVYMTGGTFEMSGGSITNNTAEFGFGGALCVDGDNNNKVTITLSDTAKISNNTATNGGGVFMKGTSSTFTMEGGTIFNNTAYNESSGTSLGTGHGGGVHIDEGTFTMFSGTISGNTANSGGAVMLEEAGTFTMEGGTISNNTATNHGGAVYMTGGIFTMSGGTIANNTATSGFGGALSVDGSNNAVDITLSGTAKISNNTATNGGGVFMKGTSSTFTMEGGTIFNNTAYNESSGTSLGTGHGGGVHIDEGTFTMFSGTISGNTAKENGGGVYVHSDGKFEMSGGTITGNTADTNGNGVYVGSIFNIEKNGEVDSVYLPNGKNITVTGTLDDATTVTGIIPAVPQEGLLVVDLAKVSEGYLSQFKLDESVKNFALKYVPNEQKQGLVLVPTHTVTFNADGGTPVPDTQTVNRGDTVTRPIEPAKDGHTFAGWHKDSACTQAWDFNDGITGSMTLYAKWTPKEPGPEPPSGGSSGDGNMDNAYRVLFNDGATTLYVVTDLSAGDKLTKPEDPVKDGYTFAGWHKDSACTQAWDFNDGITGSMTLYAKWTPQETVTPTATATVTPTVTATQTAEPTGEASPAPTVQPDNNGNNGDTTNGETTATSGISLPYLIGGIAILLLAILLLLILLLRHTVTFLIPTGGELEEYRIKVWHGRYINTEDLPDLIRTAAWYRDPARQERWDFDQDRVKKSIELYLG